MNKQNLLVGIFVTLTIVLFGAGLFLIGNQHKAFSRHTDFYTEFANVEEIETGAKVRVDGADAGQVQSVQIPSSPAHKFRLKLSVDDKLRGLIRDDSVVSIETEGVVGDKFLLIHGGGDNSPEASPGSTLSSKEPFEMSKLLAKAEGMMNQASGTVADVQKRLDGALSAVTTTVDNTNGLVTDVREGKGAAGVLLEDPATANNGRQAVVNAREATASLDTASSQVNTILNDVQQRRLVAKMDQTLQNARGATQQLDQASQQVNTTLKSAFAEDQYGEDAGSNLRQSLSNVNQATGNLTDDTAALKQEFFFRGFFKKRGYDTLDDLPVDAYRNGSLFPKMTETRFWLPADTLFTKDADGAEQLSASGRAQVDQAASQISDLYSSPLIVEGYAESGSAGDQLTMSRQRATLIRNYLQIHFHLQLKNTGVIALSGTPPVGAGKSTWSGVCLVHLAKRK